MSRVLLIEDLRRGCPMHVRAMRNAGYQVESVHTLAAALRRLGPAGHKERFDAIVVDLAEASALSGLEALKSRASGAALLGLAGLGTLCIATRSRTGLDALVIRPVNEARLLLALGELLQGEAVAARMTRALRRAASSEAHAAALEGMARELQAGAPPERVLGAAVRPYLDAEAFTAVTLLHNAEGRWRVLVEEGPALFAPLMSVLGPEELVGLLRAPEREELRGVLQALGLAALRARSLDGGALALAASTDPAFADYGEELLQAACSPWLVALRLARSIADLSASEDRFHSLADSLPRGLLVVDDHNRVGYTNAVAMELLGVDPRGQSLESLLPELGGALPIERGGRALEVGVREYADRLGRRHTTVLLTDATERRRATHALRVAAHRDDLTGLLNRRGIEAAMRELPQGTGTLALLVLDLDGFKDVNDARGHTTGDGLLRAVAEALRHAFRAEDLVARWGGDEFLVLVPDCAPEATERLREAAEDAVRQAATSLGLVVEASVGVAMGPAEPEGLEALFDRADQAMYAVKRHRSGRT